MRVVVCVKEIQGELNPFDACAVECALQIKGADVTVISMGRPSAQEVLLPLTRLGVNRTILLTDNCFAGSDTLATAYALSLAIEKISPDMVICGRQSIDGDTAQTGPCLSQMLGFSLITNCLEIKSVTDAEVACTTRAGEERVSLPALVTVERINKLRFPRIGSKLGTVEKWSAADIGADPSRCGLAGSPTRVMRTFESVIGQRKCKFVPLSDLPGLIEKGAQKQEAKADNQGNGPKLKNIWCVGEELLEIGMTIAENVRVIERDKPEKIAMLASKEKPAVILWPADLWGRRNAPIAQAILQTGLCADCTSLETDGENLFMYRPTFGGSLTAKIRCTTLPQMATVRTVGDIKREVMLSFGRGAKGCFDSFEKMAEALGAERAASRAAVDAGLAPYDMQVGLTGKTVNPRVYIACGISGAVHHTCALDRVGTVIAVNPDRNSRIFDYADYGIIATCEELKDFIL